MGWRPPWCANCTRHAKDIEALAHSVEWAMLSVPASISVCNAGDGERRNAAAVVGLQGATRRWDDTRAQGRPTAWVTDANESENWRGSRAPTRANDIPWRKGGVYICESVWVHVWLVEWGRENVN